MTTTKPQHTSRYLTACSQCFSNTSRKYAREHGGKCKACAEPQVSKAAEERNARIIDCGYQAYAMEEGHYDQGDV